MKNTIFMLALCIGIIMSVMSGAVYGLTCTADSTKTINLGETGSISVSCTDFGAVTSVSVEPTAYNGNCLSTTKSSAALTSSSSSTTFPFQATSMSCNAQVSDRTISWKFTPSTGTVPSKNTVVTITSSLSLTATFLSAQYNVSNSGNATVNLTLDLSTQSSQDITNIVITLLTNINSTDGAYNKTISLLPAQSSQQVTWTLELPPMPPGFYDFNVSVTSQNADADEATTDIMAGEGGSLTASIGLNNGWNLISVPITPSNTSLFSVLTTVQGQWESAWEYTSGSWKRYVIGGPGFLNNLNTLQQSKGYWLKVNVTSPNAINVTGTAISNTSIALQSGWNLVGYTLTSSRSRADALQSIDGKYVSAWGYSAGSFKRYVPGGPEFLNTLTNFTPGKGYWINANVSGTWTIQ